MRRSVVAVRLWWEERVMEVGRGMWGKKCGARRVWARRVCVMAVKVLQHALHVFSLSAAYQTHSLVKVLACLPWCTPYLRLIPCWCPERALPCEVFQLRGCDCGRRCMDSHLLRTQFANARRMYESASPHPDTVATAHPKTAWRISSCRGELHMQGRAARARQPGVGVGVLGCVGVRSLQVGLERLGWGPLFLVGVPRTLNLRGILRHLIHTRATRPEMASCSLPYCCSRRGYYTAGKWQLPTEERYNCAFKMNESAAAWPIPLLQVVGKPGAPVQDMSLE